MEERLHQAKIGFYDRVTEAKRMSLIGSENLGMRPGVQGHQTSLGTRRDHVRVTPRTLASAQSPKASTQ